MGRGAIFDHKKCNYSNTMAKRMNPHWKYTVEGKKYDSAAGFYCKIQIKCESKGSGKPIMSKDHLPMKGGHVFASEAQRNASFQELLNEALEMVDKHHKGQRQKELNEITEGYVLKCHLSCFMIYYLTACWVLVDTAEEVRPLRGPLVSNY